MDERNKKSPIVVAIIFLIVVGAVFAYLATRGKLVTPLPEEGMRIIFVSPLPTAIASPTASPSATPRLTPTLRPTAKPTLSTVSPTPKPSSTPTPTPTPKP